MSDRFAGARSLLALGLLAAVSPASLAASCNAATLERLVNPLVVTKADTYEVTMRRSLSSTDRADALLLKDALRKALAKDPTQVMELRGVTYTPIVSCEGFRIVGLSVRKDNVSFVAAPPAAPAAAASPAPAPSPASAPAAGASAAPVAAPAPASPSPSAAGAPAGAPQEGADRQRELTPRELTPRELTPRDLTPRELTPRELTPRELSPVPQSKPQ
jgi:hypothetical protein